MIRNPNAPAPAPVDDPQPTAPQRAAFVAKLRAIVEAWPGKEPAISVHELVTALRADPPAGFPPAMITPAMVERAAKLAGLA